MVQTLRQVIQVSQKYKKPEWVKYAYFYAADAYFAFIKKMLQPMDVQLSMLYEYYVDIILKVVQQLPECAMVEIMIGRCCKASSFLWPGVPQIQADCQTEEEILETMGYLLPGKKKRQEYPETIKIFEIITRAFFTLQANERYIGRLMQLLELYVDFEFQQVMPQIIYSMLEYSGERLLRQYGTRFIKVMQLIAQDKDGYADKIMEYSKQHMINEVQNKPQYLDLDDDERPDQSNTGIEIARRYIVRLKD